MSDNSFKFKGTIDKIFEVKEGTSNKGEWRAVEFTVVENKDTYPQSSNFRLFGSEKVDNFLQYNKVGDFVEVSFNIKTNSSKDGLRSFNSLDAWKIFKVKEGGSKQEPSVDADDLPF